MSSSGIRKLFPWQFIKYTIIPGNLMKLKDRIILMIALRNPRKKPSNPCNNNFSLSLQEKF